MNSQPQCASAVNQTQVFQMSGKFIFFSFLCRDLCCVLLSDIGTNGLFSRLFTT